MTQDELMKAEAEAFQTRMEIAAVGFQYEMEIEARKACEEWARRVIEGAKRKANWQDEFREYLVENGLPLHYMLIEE